MGRAVQWKQALTSKGDVVREAWERVTWEVPGTACRRKESQAKEVFY